jgi:hypothetical protein
VSNTICRKGLNSDGEPSTYRVQRIKPKPKSDFHARLSQVFGGGMVGMSNDGWKFVQQIMDFDYMGNAEYEFGAVPKALGNIVNERADYEAWSFTIKGCEVKLGWWRQRAFDVLRRAEIKAAKERGEKPPRMSPKHKKELVEKAGAPIPDFPIYVVSHKQQGRDLVERLIRIVGDGKMFTKGSPMFDLDREPGGYGSEFIGWFDLDNEILWFRDKTVFDGFVELFEIGQKKDAA